MVDWILNYFSEMNSALAVFLVSMLPIIELRGAIPFGVGLGMDWREVYFLSVIGNCIPVPFIILFFRPLINYLKNTKLFGKMALKLQERSLKKSKNVTKYKVLGLFLFVAIPLPGTGAWTGSAIAALLDIRLKNAIPSILLGVLCAGVLMMGISYGFGALFIHFFA